MGVVLAIGSFALWVLAYWLIVGSQSPHPQPILYFLNKAGWVGVPVGVIFWEAAYLLSEVSTGTFRFEWELLLWILIPLMLLQGGWSVAREALKEIKEMLTQKNLHLGQLCENDETQGDAQKQGEQISPELAALYNRSMNELELSVRSRKCLQWLGVNTVGDLCRHTEAELLGCKNFGMTSLVEVKQRLAEVGLSLRTLEE